MITEYLSKKMIEGNVPLFLKMILKIMAVKRNFLSKKYGKFRYYKNIEGIKEYYIDEKSFDTSKRKNGISLFARLKNAEDFLYMSVISHEEYFDEIVLVDNNSSDNTKNICLKLQKKFPKKIKFYEYKQTVYPVGDKNRNTTKDNSVHSLSYYYNWVLSKTRFKYVAKLDDDMVIYDTSEIKKITDNIRKNGINYLQILPQLNIRKKNGLFYTPISLANSKILPPIAGIYLDHGIFPINNYTYFINSKICETFLFNFSIKISKPCILHLKWLKKEIGFHNIKGNIKKNLKKEILNGKYITIKNKSIINKLNEIINNNNNI